MEENIQEACRGMKLYKYRRVFQSQFPHAQSAQLAFEETIITYATLLIMCQREADASEFL